MPLVEEHQTVVLGAGAAGLMAAIRAAEWGEAVLLLEKNQRAGVKILMSGGTRCNITQATDAAGIIDAFGRQGRFLHSALAALGPAEVIDFFESEGVATKREPTGKIFPVSNKAKDVLAALLNRLRRTSAKLALEEPALSVAVSERDGFDVTTAHRQINAGRLIITTGGQSYPGSGTTGDGYAWLSQFGHTIRAPRPALAPLRSDAAWVAELRGITLPDVTLRIVARREQSEPAGKKATLAERRSSLLFAHFGLSGPAALDVSRVVSGDEAKEPFDAILDLLPEMSEVECTERLQRLGDTEGKRKLVSWLSEHFPRRLAEVLLTIARITPDRCCHEITKQERHALLMAIKYLRIPITGSLGFKKAEVTAGGVELSEVDSRSMQSKLVPGLFLAGEILDLDGPIGGYNFQAAFSTGWLAGRGLNR